MKESKACRKI